MRAVATALVLIVGAAVVLWFGNTLNSWVLGGLIGGLAALLLSIPISLTLFSYFSRRHDDQLRAEVEEEMERARVYSAPPPVVPARTVRGAYEIEEYLADEADWDEEEQYAPDYRNRPVRNLPVPAQERLPMVSQSSRKVQAAQRADTPVRRKSRELPTAQGKEMTTRRPTSRRINTPAEPASTQSQLGLQRSAALRAARKEAVEQYDDVEVLPTTPSRRLPSARPSQQLAAQGPNSLPLRPSRQAPPPVPNTPTNQYRPRRTVESTPSRHALPAQNESSRSFSAQEPHTDYLSNQQHRPQTAPIRQQPQVPQTPQTGQIARNPQLEQQRRNPDIITGSLNAPMVRRAPYLYEDDPLLQKLEQQIDAPTVRRSSRLRQQQQE